VDRAARLQDNDIFASTSWRALQFGFLVAALGLASVMSVAPPSGGEHPTTNPITLYYVSSAHASEGDLRDLSADLWVPGRRTDDHGIALPYGFASETADHASSTSPDLLVAAYRADERGIFLPLAPPELPAVSGSGIAAPDVLQELPPGLVPQGQLARKFIMPFQNGRITSLFNQGRRHPAIDLAGALGSSVVATTSRQRVTFAGWRGGYGNAVIAQDDEGRTHLYGHLQRIVARIGNMLEQGQKLGLLGSTGHSTGPHVHYEVRTRSGQHLNPALLLFPNRMVARGYSWGAGHPTAVAVGSGAGAKDAKASARKTTAGRRSAQGRRNRAYMRDARMSSPRRWAMQRENRVALLRYCDARACVS
jgi:hypothetical protein